MSPAAGGTDEELVWMRSVDVRIQGTPIIDGVELRIHRGDRWVVLGPNGSGKTTLLALAGARRHPTSGIVRVLGVTLGHGDVRTLRARIGHSSHLLTELMPPGLRVVDVVLTGRSSSLTPWFDPVDAGDRRRAHELLEEVGCGHLAARVFATLSQGERQRVLIARALYRGAELLILDEPAAGLDFPARERLISALEATAGHPGAPAILMATHHLEEVPPSTTHAALLRQGRLVAAGLVEDVLTPRGLGECFGIELEVARRDGRWTAVGRP